MEAKKKQNKNIYISSEEVKGRIPFDDSPAKVYIMNHIIEMTIMEKKRKKGCAIRRLKHGYYLVESTGEIKKCKAKGDGEKEVNMNAKFSALRRLIEYNFRGYNSEIHLTLTYGKEMRDREKASSDFKAFWKHLRFYNQNLEYIVIYEPTKKGSWHMHVLVKDVQNRALYISRVLLEKIWKKGYVFVTKMKNNDNIGAYFMALISVDKDNPKSKGKAERLKFYTKGYRLYSRSKGILEPRCIETTYAEAKKLVEGLEPCYEKNYGIYSTDDDRELNVIYHKQYNKKRPAGKLEKNNGQA